MDKENVICPGETIKELLIVNNYTQQDLADKLNMDFKTVNQILNGKAPITVETAIKLEMIFNIDAAFWNNLEFNYRKKLKEIREQEEIEQEYEKIKLIYKEMLKRNLVLQTKDKNEIVKNFKKFMEVTSLSSIEQEYNKVACRQANIKSFDIYYLMVWIQIGIKKAREINVKKYDEKRLLARVSEIRKLTIMEDQVEAREQLKQLCNDCGIIVNFEKSMPNTAIYGIAKWLNPTTPFIQISDRGKNVATFWLSFMHELGHIIKGRKTMCFLDMEDNIIDDDEDKYILRQLEEYKANKFSRNVLIPEKEYIKLLNTIKEGNISRNQILEFANKVNIAPCIVAGRIKYDEKIYNNKILNSFNIRMEF